MILIKNGHVKTMAGPDIIGGDVLIENGKIKAVGKNLSAEGATVIDAAGRLVGDHGVLAGSGFLGTASSARSRGSAIPVRNSAGSSIRSTGRSHSSNTIRFLRFLSRFAKGENRWPGWFMLLR